MNRVNVSSNSPFEQQLGFSRAVRHGNLVMIGGTASIDDDGKTFAPGNIRAQTERCLEIIDKALNQAGARLDDVVRTRIFLTNIEHWPEVAKIKGKVFAEIRPVDTVMQVTRFIDPEWLIEIEVDAVINEWPPRSDSLQHKA